MEGACADLVILNGNIITLEGDERVEALAVKNGRIIFKGSNVEAEKYICKDTRILDVKGRTVLPGFIDTHIHFFNLGFSLMQLDLRDVDSIEELKRRVKRKVEEAEPGRWILGRGWDQERFAEKRYPNRWDLDEVAKDNPVMLRRVCGHICVVNSKALKMAGIDRETLNPEGGMIDRDENGEPTGILREKAMNLIWSVIPPPGREEYLEALNLATEEALKHGLTSIHLVSATPEEIRTLQIARRLGKLKIRVSLYVSAAYLKNLVNLGIMRGFGDEYLKINGVKLLVDGSLGARTAAMRKPYSDDPDNRGILTMTFNELKNIISTAHKGNLQLAIHAIGDRAVETVLKALDEVLKEHPMKDHRHRLEHASILAAELIDEMKRLGVAASVQPRFIISDFWAVERVGCERAKWTYPFKSLMEREILIGGGSDSPVDPLNPIYQIYSAVTRGRYEGIELYKYTVNECLEPIDAIRLFTLNAAKLGFEEDVKGSIKIGKFADLIVLSHDPTEINGEELKNIKVLITIVNGEIAYSST